MTNLGREIGCWLIQETDPNSGGSSFNVSAVEVVIVRQEGDWVKLKKDNSEAYWRHKKGIVFITQLV